MGSSAKFYKIGERGDQTAEGHCRWCGAKLVADHKYRNGKSGYCGDGAFCSLRCGYMFAKYFAKVGYVIATQERGKKK